MVVSGSLLRRILLSNLIGFFILVGGILYLGWVNTWLIDTKVEDYNAVLPNDENHKHFGAGQTEAAIGLPPGKHTLQAIFADMNHIPHDPPVESEVITITVE